MPDYPDPEVPGERRPAQARDPGWRSGPRWWADRGLARPFRAGTGVPWTTWSGAWSAATVGGALIVAILAATGFGGPIRAVVTVLFAVTCPGMSLVRLLRLQDPLAELTLGIATSVALAGLVGGILLYYGLWNPGLGLAILVVIALAGTIGEPVFSRLRRALRSQDAAPGSSGLRGTLVSDLPPAPFAVVHRRSPAGPDARPGPEPGERAAPLSDPLAPRPPRRATQKTIDRAVDELARRRDEQQP